VDVWIIDPDTGVGLSVIDAYTDVEWSRLLYESHGVRLSMQVEDLAATEIAKGRYLWVQDEVSTGHLFLIESVEIDTAADVPPVGVVGRDVTASYFAHRVLIPPPGSDHLTFSGPIESALHFYVDQSLGPSAAVARRLPNLTMGVDGGRGDTVDLAARYQPLGEFLEAVAKPQGFGWEVLWDPDTHTFEFQTIVGTDRTTTVFIDPEFETADEIRWLQTLIDKKTVAIVAGQGDGDARTILTIFEGAEPTGLDRREVFIDARDTDDLDLLTERGKEALASAAEEDAFQVTIHPHGSFQYPEHFDLGDTVTIRSAAFGLEAQAQIVGVTQKVSSGEGGGRTTTIQVGQVWPTLFRRVRQMADRPSASGRA
jgi:hypothetical protein